MRALSWIVEVIWINVLMVVTSIPIITIGAALTAGYDAARRLRMSEGKTASNYFRAFKSNFGKATILWLIMGPLGAAIVALWLFVQLTPLLVIKFAVSILWIIAFLWLWPVQARFENSVGKQLWNAFLIGLNRFGFTLTLLIIDIAYVALVVSSWLYMPQGLFLLAVLGVGLLTALHVPVVEKGLEPFIEKAPKASPSADGEAQALVAATDTEVGAAGSGTEAADAIGARAEAGASTDAPAVPRP